jgi:hypothetical protein
MEQVRRHSPVVGDHNTVNACNETVSQRVASRIYETGSIRETG